MPPRYTFEAFGAPGSLFCNVNSGEGLKDIEPTLRKKRKKDTASPPSFLPPFLRPSLPGPQEHCEHLFLPGSMPDTENTNILPPIQMLAGQWREGTSRQIFMTLRGKYKIQGMSGPRELAHESPGRSGKATENRLPLHWSLKDDSELSRENPGQQLTGQGLPGGK